MRKLAAIMFTDITGYSALMSKDENLAMRILEKNRMIHKNLITRHDGEYIKEIGDGTLAIFNSSLNAVLCALEIRHACLRANEFRVRIGIHTGDIVKDHNDVFGDGVNIASRIEAIGEPGEIFISEKVYDDIKNITGIKTIFIGEKQLKNIDQPVKIYKIDEGTKKFHIKKDDSSSHVQSQTRHRTTGKYLYNRPWIWKAVTITAIIAVIVAIIQFVMSEKKDKSPKRIVVAIFENRTNDPSLDVLGKLSSDWITQGLSRSGEIEVVPSTTVMHIYNNLESAGTAVKQNKFLSALITETNAGILVTGSYYLQQGLLQFSVEVKDVKTGELLYAPDAISGDVDHTMAAIEKLSNEIIGGLAYHIKISPIGDLSKPPNKEAYIAYLTGLELFGYDYPAAIRQFMKAARSDSLFIPPKVYIAMAFANQEKYARADSMVSIIITMRDRLTVTENHILNYLIAHIEGKNTECLRHLKLAEKSSPTGKTIKYLIGLYTYRVNSPEAAVKILQQLDFHSTYHGKTIIDIWKRWILCDALHLLERYKEELNEAEKGIAEYPGYTDFYVLAVSAHAALGQQAEIDKIIEECKTIGLQEGTLGDVMLEAAQELMRHGNKETSIGYAALAGDWYLKQGHDFKQNAAIAFYYGEQWEKSRLLFEQLAKENPEDYDYAGYLGALAARRGDVVLARNIADSLQNLDGPYLRGRNTLWCARITALLGDNAQAVELLRQSLAQGRPFGSYLLQIIDFEPLKGDLAFEELMKPKEI